MKPICRLTWAFAVCLCAFCPAGAQQIISLAGAWDFAIDTTAAAPLTPPAFGEPADGGALSGNDHAAGGYVMLPGSMLTNGKGMPVSTKTQWTGSLYDSSFYFNPYMEKYRHESHPSAVAADGAGLVKFPFFLTPARHYVGKAWYRRQVYVPQSWKDQRITLFLERPHIETTVWVNGQPVGHQMSLSTPHRYDVTKQVRLGQKNEIVICVYNGIENVCVGQDSHSVTDQTQGNWNGIVGRLELQAQWNRVNISRVRVFPDAARRRVRVSVELGDHISPFRLMPIYDYTVHVCVRPLSGGPAYYYRKEATGRKREFLIDLDSAARFWDEFNPNLYQLTIEAGDDVYETIFGLRDIKVQGSQFYVNGRPTYLRGTVENCCFPLTGYPPTDEDEWLRIFRKCKEYGLNHVRFHSYCPPDAAFCAADQVGIYLQVEGPSWPNHGVRLRSGQKIDDYLLEESKRIVDEYGHHPSFVMMAAGNEPAGDWVSYCNDWVKEMHQYDSTRVYCGASVGGGWAWDDGSEYHVKGGARGLDWDRHAPQSEDDYFDQLLRPRNYKGEQDNHSPIIAHEQGQWCAFPDFKEIPQYTGAYKPGNFEIFRDLLRDNGMAQMAEKFLMASGRLQTLCYKYEIERNLRTPEYAGFQLLGLNDYSGQGTALVGPLNVFWREKGYVSAREWREFCSPIVPLARFPKFVYTTADTLNVPIEAYSAYHVKVNATYLIHDDSLRIVAMGQLPIMSRQSAAVLPIGKNTQLGSVVMPLDSIRRPTKLTLTVQLGGSTQNHWDFWVYPEAVGDETLAVGSEKPAAGDETLALSVGTRQVGTRSNRYASILIADTLSKQALETLERGGTVLIEAAGKVTLGSDVVQHYLPVFWNTSWFKMRPPHTTGAYIDTQHPLFRHGFPTDDWSNLNWWELLNRAQVMNLMELPADYQPPIQPIDTWHVSRKLGMLIEARVGKGRLLMTTMDISRDLSHRPVARQMRRAILSYMQSPDFQPALTLTPEIVGHFFTRQAPPVNMFTNDSPDELKPKLK